MIVVRWSSFGRVEFYYRVDNQNRSGKSDRAVAKHFTISYKHTSSFMSFGFILAWASWKLRLRWTVLYRWLIEGFREGQQGSEGSRDRAGAKPRSGFSLSQLQLILWAVEESWTVKLPQLELLGLEALAVGSAWAGFNLGVFWQDHSCRSTGLRHFNSRNWYLQFSMESEMFHGKKSQQTEKKELS